MAFKEQWQRFRALPKWEQAFLAFFVAFLAHYGSTKGFHGSVTYERTDADIAYLIDRGSYVTNDYVHVDFVTQIIPQTANFYGEYRASDQTNDTDWVEFVNTTVGDFSPPQDIAFDNATNYNFRFYTDWVPAPTVHTNGVLEVKWAKDKTPPPDLAIGIPIRSEVILDGEKIAPPVIEIPEGDEQ